MACVQQGASDVVLTPELLAIVSTDVSAGETLELEVAAAREHGARLFPERRRNRRILYLTFTAEAAAAAVAAAAAAAVAAAVAVTGPSVIAITTVTPFKSNRCTEIPSLEGRGRKKPRPSLCDRPKFLKFAYVTRKSGRFCLCDILENVDLEKPRFKVVRALTLS